MGSSGWGYSLAWFALVVAAIPVALWLLRRTPLVAGAGHARPGVPQTVAVLPLSPQQRLVTVEVGTGESRQWLVLGVTPQGIRTLHTMAALAPAAAGEGGASGAPHSFAQMLGRLRRGATGSGGADAR